MYSYLFIQNKIIRIRNTVSVMIIFILPLLLTNWHLRLLSIQGIGADKLHSTQKVKSILDQLRKIFCVTTIVINVR